METLLILIILVVVLDIASLRWGFDSTEKLDSPERERAVLTYRFMLGLSTRETAVRLGLTEGNVKAVQHRALKRAAALDAG